MRPHRRASATGVLAGSLSAGICVCVIVLVAFAYRGIREWRDSERRLAERRSRETMDTVVTALTRDMRGVQQGVLPSLWDEFGPRSSNDGPSVIAAAFARYPYPESFFAWREGSDASVRFFTRADRRPDWMAGTAEPGGFPVSPAYDADLETVLRSRVGRDARQGRAFSTFETLLRGTDYQVVARLHYRDGYREQLDGVVGFTVNLAWVRRHYFPVVAAQVAGIVGGVPFVVVDERQRPVTGTLSEPVGASPLRRSFPVMFFDPLVAGLDVRADLPRQSWAVVIDPERELRTSAAGAVLTFAITAVSAAMLIVGVILTARAARANARLADLRADFVSTVTHDLKTPIATIRAVGDTIARGRVSDASALREYAQIVVQESKRLTRLVENLLAYARVIDITEVYAFESLHLSTIVEEVLQDFRAALQEGGFEVVVDLPGDIPAVRADPTALRLALDNVVDNAIRYSGRSRWLSLVARRADPLVSLDISDRGIGIAHDEVGQVTRKFFRGRRSPNAGSGLGLAIANRVVSDHGGQLTIESRPGAGTTVRLAIPASKDTQDEAASSRRRG